MGACCAATRARSHPGPSPGWPMISQPSGAVSEKAQRRMRIPSLRDPSTPLVDTRGHPVVLKHVFSRELGQELGRLAGVWLVHGSLCIGGRRASCRQDVMKNVQEVQAAGIKIACLFGSATKQGDTNGEIPPGVGPRFPQVVMLVGATGDLARREEPPPLPACSTSAARASSPAAGSSASRSTNWTPRAFAPPRAARWTSSAAARSWRPIGTPSPASSTTRCRCRAVRRRSRRRWSAPGSLAAPECRRRALPERAAERGPVGGAHAGRGQPGRPGPHHHGKAVRHGLAECRAIQRHGP